MSHHGQFDVFHSHSSSTPIFQTHQVIEDKWVKLPCVFLNVVGFILNDKSLQTTWKEIGFVLNMMKKF